MRISQFRGALPAASLLDGRSERKPAQSDRRVHSNVISVSPAFIISIFLSILEAFLIRIRFL